jgi:hypothetical protein
MPYVSDVLVGAVSRTEVVGIVVPVLRGGEVAYFLTASLPLERIRDILTQAGIGDGRAAAVADRKGKLLAVVPDGSPGTEDGGARDLIRI